jgi:hypothetical protein
LTANLLLEKTAANREVAFLTTLSSSKSFPISDGASGELIISTVVQAQMNIKKTIVKNLNLNILNPIYILYFLKV